MPPALESPPAGTTTASRRIEVIFRALGVIAMVLVMFAVGLRAIAAANTDLPTVSDFLREAHEFYGRDLHGAAGVHSSIDQAPGARAWVEAVLGINQQWDARVLSVGNLALLVLGLGAFWSLLKRTVKISWLVGLSMGLGIVLELAPVLPRSSWEVTWAGGVLLLSIGHLAGMSRPPSERGAMFFGFACGVLNLAAATAGVASALALVIGLAVEMARDPGARKNRRVALMLNGVLVVAGMFLAVARSGGVSEGSFFARLEALLSWPSASWGGIALMWAPALAGCGLWLRPRRTEREARLELLGLLATWMLIQVVVVAGVGGGNFRSSLPLLIAGLVVNAACFSVFPLAGGAVWSAIKRSSVCGPSRSSTEC